MITINLHVTASDLVTPAKDLTCRVASVGSNERDNGLGDGDTAPDWFFSGSDLREASEPEWQSSSALEN